MKYILLLVSSLILSACYEEPSVTVHEAGVYKGKTDLHALTAQEREAVLAKRFSQVQTDR